MTEHEARQVLLLRSLEAGAVTPLWTAEDRAWATRQTVALVGETAAPERFVVARAALALQRLLPRDRSAQRWLERRAWHPAWVLLGLLAGLLGGLAADQLGPPQRVNLLAPALWAVVAWNLAVYAALLLPLPGSGLRRWLSNWLQSREGGAGAFWIEPAAPLTAARAALVLHAAAAALALGLMAGLYLRGLVLDYRAGWQSTFLDAGAVQALLGTLLAPAAALMGLSLPDVAPLRVSPGADATATAAPWIHLFAGTLALFVLLPRTLLALVAGARALRLSRHFPLDLTEPYFERLHPLMRPGQARALRLAWVAPPGQSLTLFDRQVADMAAPLTLLRSDEGDELQLLTVPEGLDADPAPRAPAWAFWRAPPDPAVTPLARLRRDIDAVLLVTTPGATRPAWLALLARPLVVLLDAPTAEPPALPLASRAEGWLAEGRLLRALEAALDGDPRLARLSDAWQRQQRARFDTAMTELAATLARIAGTRVPLADGGMLTRKADAEAAREALIASLDEALQSNAALAAALHMRVGEGRVALLGGVLTGALAGLKADLLTGGLTMGAGALAGGVLGAMGAAGVARGLNIVRGTERSYATWNDEAMTAITEALLLRTLTGPFGLAEAEARTRLAAALAPQQAVLARLWQGRSSKAQASGAAEVAAAILQPLLSRVTQDALR